MRVITCTTSCVMHIVLDGFSVWCFWHWFVVPAGGRPISFAVAIGLGWFLSWAVELLPKKPYVEDAGVWTKVALHCASDGFYLAVGWIVSRFV